MSGNPTYQDLLDDKVMKLGYVDWAVIFSADSEVKATSGGGQLEPKDMERILKAFKVETLRGAMYIGEHRYNLTSREDSPDYSGVEINGQAAGLSGLFMVKTEHLIIAAHWPDSMPYEGKKEVRRAVDIAQKTSYR